MSISKTKLNKFRRDLKKNPLLQRFSSIKITVVCLFLLFILTFWGTVAQIDSGLYLAQERYFHSLFFTIAGFLPFPGAQLVLWVLFINLVSVAITRFVYKLSHIGICIIHIGLLTYFVSAFITFHVVEESNLTLLEGEGSNVSSSYHDWELSIWKQGEGKKRNVVAIDTRDFKPGQVITSPNLGIRIAVKAFYQNAEAFTTSKIEQGGSSVMNASGIKSLAEIPLNKEREQNLAGGLFELIGINGKNMTLLLYGAETNPTRVPIGQTRYNFMLRRKRSVLPFALTLKNFEMEVHPGTEVARSYKSLVQVEHEGLSREVLIWMNHPLRHKNYTLYQASYSIDTMGRVRSTLAVVRNVGRLLPYMASLITFVGLVTHFLLLAFSVKRRK